MNIEQKQNYHLNQFPIIKKLINRLCIFKIGRGQKDYPNYASNGMYIGMRANVISIEKCQKSRGTIGNHDIVGACA